MLISAQEVTTPPRTSAILCPIFQQYHDIIHISLPSSLNSTLPLIQYHDVHPPSLPPSVSPSLFLYLSLSIYLELWSSLAGQNLPRMPKVLCSIPDHLCMVGGTLRHLERTLNIHSIYISIYL